MHELLKKFWKENALESSGKYLVEPMRVFFKSTLSQFLSKEKKKLGDAYEPHAAFEKYEETAVTGLTFENHIGIDTVKQLAGEGLYVYGMRHPDNGDFCRPATLEPHEVYVNFYAYFVTDQPLDHFFKPTKDWKKIYDWSMDWGDEHYWE